MTGTDSADYGNFCIAQLGRHGHGLRRDPAVLEIGTWGSGLLPELHKRGFVNLYGIDKNRNVYDMPFYTKVRYLYGKGQNTHFPDSFFDLVCATHFDNVEQLLREAARVLKPGGILVLKATEQFAESIRGIAAENGLDVAETGKAMISLVCKRQKLLDSLPKAIAIVNYLGGGMAVYSNELSQRLRKEYGARTIIVDDARKVPGDFKYVVIEHERGIPDRDRVLKRDLEFLERSGRKVFVEVHTLFGFGKDPHNLKARISKVTCLYRLQELAEMDRANSYFLMPHISYKSTPISKFKKVKPCVGTYGYTSVHKNVDEVIRFAKEAGLDGRILLSKDPQSGTKHDRLINRLLSMGDQRVRVTLQPGGIKEGMAECSHILFAHASTYSLSGTMKLGKRFNRPIVATDTLLSKEAQVVRVMKFTNSLSFLFRFVYNELRGEAYYYYHRRDFSLGTIYTSIKLLSSRFIRFIASKPLTREQLMRISDRNTRDEDGLEYLVKVMRSSP